MEEGSFIRVTAKGDEMRGNVLLTYLFAACKDPALPPNCAVTPSPSQDICAPPTASAMSSSLGSLVALQSLSREMRSACQNQNKKRTRCFIIPALSIKVQPRLVSDWH